MKNFLFVLSSFFIILFFNSFAQDIEDSKDHPMFNRMSGFYITEYLAEDFGTHEFYYLDKNEIVEGKKLP